MSSAAPVDRFGTVLPCECPSCRRSASECRLRAGQGPCCPSCRCDVPILVDDRQELARRLLQIQSELDRANGLLLRAEPFVPRMQCAALLSDVRAHLGIDERGFRRELRPR